MTSPIEQLSAALAAEHGAARDIYWKVALDPSAAIDLVVLRGALGVLGRSTRDLHDDVQRCVAARALRERANPAPARAAMATALADLQAAETERELRAAALAEAEARVAVAANATHAAKMLAEDAATAAQHADAAEIELHRRGCPTFADAPVVIAARDHAAQQRRLQAEQQAQLDGAAAEQHEADVAMDRAEAIAAPGSFVRLRGEAQPAPEGANDVTAEESRLSAAVRDGSLVAAAEATQ